MRELGRALTAAILALCLTVSAGGAAFATDSEDSGEKSTGIIVGEQTAVSEGRALAAKGDGWRYDAGVLTLDGYDGGRIAVFGMNLDIVLAGENKITTVDDYCIFSTDAVTISGDGALALDCVGSGEYTFANILTEGSIAIKGGTIRAKTSCDTEAICIWTEKNLVINGGDLRLRADAGSALGLAAENIDIKGGTVRIEAQGVSQAAGSRAVNRHTISGGALRISSTAEHDAYGVASNYGDNRIRGGSVIVDAVSTYADAERAALTKIMTNAYGIFSGKDIVVERGATTVNAAGVYEIYALCAQGGIAVEGGLLTATAQCPSNNAGAFTAADGVALKTGARILQGASADTAAASTQNAWDTALSLRLVYDPEDDLDYHTSMRFVEIW